MPVTKVRRKPDRVEVSAANGETGYFDHVVIATQSDQSLAILADPSDMERRVLGNIIYQENETVLHTDTSVLPPKRSACASWNYFNPS